MIIGRVIDIRPVDGNIRGPQVNEADTEPGDEGIDSGFTFADFAIGRARLILVSTRSVAQVIVCLRTGGPVGGGGKCTLSLYETARSPSDSTGPTRSSRATNRAVCTKRDRLLVVSSRVRDCSIAATLLRRIPSPDLSI